MKHKSKNEHNLFRIKTPLDSINNNYFINKDYILEKNKKLKDFLEKELGEKREIRRGIKIKKEEEIKIKKIPERVLNEPIHFGSLDYIKYKLLENVDVYNSLQLKAQMLQCDNFVGGKEVDIKNLKIITTPKKELTLSPQKKNTPLKCIRSFSNEKLDKMYIKNKINNISIHKSNIKKNLTLQNFSRYSSTINSSDNFNLETNRTKSTIFDYKHKGKENTERKKLHKDLINEINNLDFKTQIIDSKIYQIIKNSNIKLNKKIKLLLEDRKNDANLILENRKIRTKTNVVLSKEDIQNAFKNPDKVEIDLSENSSALRSISNKIKRMGDDDALKFADIFAEDYLKERKKYDNKLTKIKKKEAEKNKYNITTQFNKKRMKILDYNNDTIVNLAKKIKYKFNYLYKNFYNLNINKKHSKINSTSL